MLTKHLWNLKTLYLTALQMNQWTSILHILPVEKHFIYWYLAFFFCKELLTVNYENKLKILSNSSYVLQAFKTKYRISINLKTQNVRKLERWHLIMWRTVWKSLRGGNPTSEILSATIICNQQWITVKEQGSPVLPLHPGSKLPKRKKKIHHHL